MKVTPQKPLLFFMILGLVFSSCHSHKSASHTSGTKTYSAVQTKYSGILGVDVSTVNNTKLYDFIDDWTGTPYKYGGKNKSGIDCSAFTETLYNTVYERIVTGSSRDLFEKCTAVSKSDLREGDLVFFKIESDKISHVGVYLTNDKFVHATVKKGVMISDLKETYYMKYYYKGGRLK